jgi:hypothetical protein
LIVASGSSPANRTIQYFDKTSANLENPDFAQHSINSVFAVDASWFPLLPVSNKFIAPQNATKKG